MPIKVPSGSLAKTVTYADRNPDAPLSGGDAALGWVATALATESTVIISTDGTYAFGAKPQAAPELFWKGSNVWENGVLSAAEQGLAEDSPVPVDGLWDRQGGDVTIDKSSLRNSEIDQQYVGRKGGWVGWPMAVGGDDTRYADKLYVAYNAKISSDINSFRRCAYNSLSGLFNEGLTEFDRGEDISFSGYAGNGKIIYVDTANLQVHIEVPAGSNQSGLNGNTITGLSSGATLVLDTATDYQAPGGTKTIRIWENPSTTSTTTAFGNYLGIYTGDSFDGANTRIDRQQATGASKGDVDQWDLWEYTVDYSGATGTGTVKTNNAGATTFAGLNLANKSPTHGPTASNIGNDIPVDGMSNTEIYFEGCYQDTTFQRVVIGDASTFAACTKFEHQRLTAWSGSSIECRLYHGDLADGWLYVVGADNLPVTSTGVKII